MCVCVCLGVHLTLLDCFCSSRCREEAVLKTTFGMHLEVSVGRPQPTIPTNSLNMYFADKTTMYRSQKTSRIEDPF